MSEQPPVKPVLTKKQAQRANSTVIGMLIAIGLSLLLVLPVLLLVPQKNQDTFQRNVNVSAVASQAAVGTFRPAAPSLPEGFHSNHADYSAGGSAKVQTWTVGYVTPSNTYLQFVQTDKANPTWLAQQVNGPKLESRSIGGTSWDIYATGKDEQTWVNVRHGNTYLVSGQASDEDKTTLATALAATNPLSK